MLPELLNHILEYYQKQSQLISTLPPKKSISLGEDSTRRGRLDSPPQRINGDKESARLGLIYTPTPKRPAVETGPASERRV